MGVEYDVYHSMVYFLLYLDWVIICVVEL